MGESIEGGQSGDGKQQTEYAAELTRLRLAHAVSMNEALAQNNSVLREQLRSRCGGKGKGKDGGKGA